MCFVCETWAWKLLTNAKNSMYRGVKQLAMAVVHLMIIVLLFELPSNQIYDILWNMYKINKCGGNEVAYIHTQFEKR